MSKGSTLLLLALVGLFAATLVLAKRDEEDEEITDLME